MQAHTGSKLLNSYIVFFRTNDFQTLPLLIYSMTKKEVTPDLYALSSLMVGAVLLLLILSNLIDAKGKDKANETPAEMAERKLV